VSKPRGGAADRATRHRLRPALALRDPVEARDFVRALGVVVRTPDRWLPSLFAAAQGKAARPGGKGFATWPAHAWWWGGAMADDGDILATKALRGRTAYVARPLWPALDAAVRGRGAALAGAPADLLACLRAAGRPLRTDEWRRAAGFAGPTRTAPFRKARGVLEALGVVLEEAAPMDERHEHVALAQPWEARFRAPLARARGVDAFVRATLAAAGDAPARVVAGWFGWPRAETTAAVARLVAAGAVHRAAGGQLRAAAPAPADLGADA
jgi:hypothetical protein